MRPWWSLVDQPDMTEELNEADRDHTVSVPSRGGRTLGGWEDVEVVHCRPEAADQWDARLWRPRP